MTHEKPILVLGSTGKTGRRVVERLTARGIPTRMGVRSGEPPFDWDDPDTWAPVLQGVGSVYVQHYLDALLAGELALPAGKTPEPFVDAEDIADVAVAALTEDGHVGESYELTGPRLLTFADAVGEIAQATGREIRYVPVSSEDFAAGLDEQAVPGEWI